MMLPVFLQNDIEEKYFEQFGIQLKIQKSVSTGGGCINNTAALKTNHGSFFIKWNNKNLYPLMFEQELKGLNILLNAACIKVPKPLFTSQTAHVSYLFMEHIESGMKEQGFWENFGCQLALLHKQTNEYFGLEHDNYIGSLYQNNNFASTWVEFFINQRLERQLHYAKDTYHLSSALINHFENLYLLLTDIFPVEKPSLLHGDLWNGNYMVSSDGSPCIIDPAVYYGHREMDLAMSRLFGGFSHEFYASYHNTYPLEKDWEQRVDICNLYPLLVHLNLFGTAYLQQIERIVRIF